MTSPARVPALDGLRGVAILLVLAGHVVMDAAPSGATRWLLAPLRAGWLGVDLFFALSGYLITAQLVATRGAPDYVRAFYGRRVRRIWPLYLLFVATLAAVAWGLAAGTPWGAHARPVLPWLAAHLANVPIARAGSLAAVPDGTQHLWSLAIEEQFYLLWPLVVAVVAPRRLLAVALAGAGASVALRLALGAAVHPATAFVLPVSHADGLMLGAAVAVAAARGVRLPAVRHPVAFAAGVYLAVAALEAARGLLHPAVQASGVLAWSLASAGLVAWARTAGPSALDAAWLRWCGRRSYGLYVWHFPLLAAAGLLADPPAGAAGLAVMLQRLAVVACAFPLAEASWRYWERRWLVPAADPGTARATAAASPAGRPEAIARST